jgi:hypothetical protein
MTTQTAQISFSHEQLDRVCRQYHVRRLSLFGSVRRRDFGPQSDVDVLVEFEEGQEPSLAGLARLQGELSGVFGEREVDVATPSILANPYRRKSILRDLQPIYGA